jgi:hypothetical protein
LGGRPKCQDNSKTMLTNTAPVVCLYRMGERGLDRITPSRAQPGLTRNG